MRQKEIDALDIREVVARERVADALARIAAAAERFCDAVYPVYTGTENAEITRVGQSAPEPQSPEEYASFPEGEPGRYETLLKTAGVRRD